MNKKFLNNGIFYVVISLVAVLAVGAGVYAYTLSQSVNVSDGGVYNYYEAEGQPAPEDVTLGASAGPNIYWDTNVYGSFTKGIGDYLATSTDAAAFTLTYSDLNDYTYIDVLNTQATGNLEYTLPATSTMVQILPDVGATRTWLFHNASSTAPTLTFVTGAGMDLVGVSNATDIIDAGEWAQLTCTRIYYRSADNENIMCIVDELENSE